MEERQKIPESAQTEVLLRSRRRCCICFGLNRDEEIKKGQIAHLDQNRENNNLTNLAFLCFDHHDEYDGKTSQAKKLRIEEVKQHREELYRRFEDWKSPAHRDQLLNFLAAIITIDQMTDGAIKMASRQLFYGEEHAYDVLVRKKVDYSDGDLLFPHLVVLDEFASWGWLTFTEESRKSSSGELRTYITVKHAPICWKVAETIRKRFEARGDSVKNLNWIDARADTFTDERMP